MPVTDAKQGSLNVLDAFLILLALTFIIAVYLHFTGHPSFSHLIRREGVPRHARVEILIDPDWARNLPPVGTERQDFYGRIFWKVLAFDKRLCKAELLLLVKQDDSNTVRFGKYFLKQGQSLYLDAGNFSLRGKLLTLELARKNIPF